MAKETHITKTVAQCVGARQSTKVELVVDISSGKAELIVEKTFVDYYPVSDYEEVMKLYDRLNDIRHTNTLKEKFL